MYIKSKLNGCGNFVNILTAGSGGLDKFFFYFSFRNGEGPCNSDHIGKLSDGLERNIQYTIAR